MTMSTCLLTCGLLGSLNGELGETKVAQAHIPCGGQHARPSAMMGRGMPWREAWQRRLGSWRRTLDDLLPWRAGRLSLWLALITLVLAMLAILVWLAGRYEDSQVQAELDGASLGSAYP